jgi:hypothetical protein
MAKRTNTTSNARSKREACIKALRALPTSAGAADIQRIVETHCPEMMDEIILDGARLLTVDLRRSMLRLVQKKQQ